MHAAFLGTVKIGEKHRKTLSQTLEKQHGRQHGSSWKHYETNAKQITADLSSVESGRQMSGVNDWGSEGGGWGGAREKDSDKCGSVVLIVRRCPAISPHCAKPP